MTETKNYGFQKPDPADLVDVGVINRNFDKVDEELARKTIPIVLDQEIDLTQDFNSINVTEQIAAVADRFVSDLKRGTPVSVSLIHQDKPFVFLLTDWFQSREDYFVVWGTFSNPHDVTKISSFILYAFLGHGSDLEYHAGIGGSGGGSLPADFPVSVDENGYTQIARLPRATNIDNVLDGDVLTVTSTLQDGRTIPGTMTFDANGMPESYTEEGVACKFSFTGFDKPKTVELPVVELTGCVSGEDITDETIINTLNSLLQNNIAFVGKVDISYLGTAYGVFSLVTNDEGTSFFMSMIAAFGVSFLYMDGKWSYSAEPFAVG